MKYRPGDVLLVRATVVEDPALPSGISARLVMDEAYVDVARLDVVSVERAIIQIGDTVRRPVNQVDWSYGKVLCVADDALWVQLSKDSSLQTWRTSECERVD